MTLDEMRDMIWKLGGEPTDLDPDSDVQYNGGPLLTWAVNEGQRAVASWKHPATRRRFKIENLEGEFFFKVGTITGTLDSDGSTTTVVLPSGDVGADDDRYNGWLIAIGSEVRIIVDYDGTTRTATVQEAFSTAPTTSDTYTIYKRYVHLLPAGHTWASENVTLPSTFDTTVPVGNYLTILKLINVNDQSEIEEAPDYEDFQGKMLSTGTPGEYIMKGNRIQFDSAPDEDIWFKADYARLPTDLSGDSDEPELPEHLHYAVVLWGVWWIYGYEQENSSKYVAKRDFDDFMKRTLSQYDLKHERQEVYGVHKME